MRFATDGILFKNGKILLIRRAGHTFHNFWALPGGILEEGETIEQALVREMLEELGVTAYPLEILGVYSKPERDPREQTISVVFICDYDGLPQAADDAAAFGEFSLTEIELLELAFDHAKILFDFKKWLHKQETFWSSK
ncbi:MAG: NUDIX hydrolase [Candidatus Heimdallarchaeota archaeon]|nr:NUDIX hydrolase [Candidatus Heimdallarchaeota archaeon]